MPQKTLDVVKKIAQVIYDKKGMNILAVDVRGLSTLTDFLVVAEGNVERHVAGIARSIIDEMESSGDAELIRSEGLKNSEWIVLDFGDVMVHLFSPNLRERYALEKLWEESKLVDLEINTHS